MVRKAMISTALLISLFAPLAFSAPPPGVGQPSYIKLAINSAKYIDMDTFWCILIDITLENTTPLTLSGGKSDFKLKDVENGYAYTPGMSCALPAELKYDLWSMDKIEPHTKGRGVVCFELPKNRQGKLRVYFNGKITDSLNKFVGITDISHSIIPVDYNEPDKPQKSQPVEDTGLSSDKAKVTKKGKDVITVSEKEDVTVINIKGPKIPIDDEKEAIVKLSDILAPKDEKTGKDLQKAEAIERMLDKLESDLIRKREAQRESQAEIRQITTQDFEVTDLAIEKIENYRYKVSGNIKNNTDFYFDYVKFKAFLEGGLNNILKEGSFTCTPFAPGERKHFEDEIKYDGLMLVEKGDVELNYFLIRK